jgi:hypothetical protein
MGPNRAVAALCIAIIAIAAFLPPGLATLDDAWFELTWVLLPLPAAATPVAPFTAPRERSLRLGSLLSSRAPPFSA